MKKKIDCWEYKQCCRQPGGKKVKELGVCPAAIDSSGRGINGGKNAGRICWAVAGTYCDGEIQGTFAQKLTACVTCDFYFQVKREEGSIYFKLLIPDDSS
ncbi:MAG: hypothetical protein A2Y62_21560 [Candidatus Fischerbacteria bacterium RBG_13_37_8]|uniref:Uncharacterized protein n=1 Tax=Candidatus Fischerbacteria bacterium RBG_13_37_8 TaxID=1817863 RepID=A0A1F5VKA8_9BACT|nr:MAG: hypothetical protein A2Y62_21560 [Candidatus Fischerbacteria bacterium RBG_13_37_8]